MRYVLLLAAAGLSLFALSLTLHAQQAPMIELPKGWRASKSGNCFAAKMVTPRVYFAFGPSSEGGWLVNLRRVGGFGPGATVSGSPQSIALAISGATIYSGSIHFKAADWGFLSPPLTSSQIHRLIREPVLTFVGGGTTYEYDIAGMNAAMVEVQRCNERNGSRVKIDKDAVAKLPRWSSINSPSIDFKGKDHRPELLPTEIFKRVAASVYIVKAAANVDAIVHGPAITGSAVAVSGNIALTNCHVVKGQSVIAVYPSTTKGENSAPLMARPYKADLETDRCLLFVEGELNAVSGVRKIDSVEIGERVYTIGNPKGLSNSLGDGLVSGLREYRKIVMIQTSAPISSGSSGGALVDARGALLGITTLMVKDAQNLNFAIAAEEYWR